MALFEDFTVNSNFEAQNLSALITGTPGLHWISILDPGIAGRHGMHRGQVDPTRAAR